MTRTRRLNSRVISLCLTAAILLTALIGKYLLWSSQSVPTIDEVPEFSGKPYVEINDNKPKFNEKDKKRKIASMCAQERSSRIMDHKLVMPPSMPMVF